jgi:hypothetical protein
MSPSELGSAAELADLARQLTDAADRARDEDIMAVPQDVLRGLVSTAVRLYARAGEAVSADIEPLEPEISATDAVVMACALLRARDLNPFDLALWFSRPRAAG